MRTIIRDIQAIQDEYLASLEQLDALLGVVKQQQLLIEKLRKALDQALDS